MPDVEWTTPVKTPATLGYGDLAKVGNLIMIGGTAGIEPNARKPSPDVGAQTEQILENFRVMLESAGSDLAHVIHFTVFLLDIGDLVAMDTAFTQKIGTHRPARTVVGVRELPRWGVRVTMNLTAVTID